MKVTDDGTTNPLTVSESEYVRRLENEIERLTRHDVEAEIKAAVAATRSMYKAQVERLRAVRDAADLLVNECEGGIRSPSLGLLARLESALAMEKKK